MGKWEMEKDEDFYKEVIKCYVREYKKHRKTIRIPLSIFHPEITNNIYLTPFDDQLKRKMHHYVKTQNHFDGLIKGASIEIQLNQSNKTITDDIFTYVIRNEIEEYIKKKEEEVE